MRVAICDPRPKARAALRQAVEAIAAEAGMGPLAVMQHESAAAACEALGRLRPGYCTLALCNLDFPAAEDAGALARFKESFPQTRLVLLSSSQAAAIQAYRVHADGFALMGDGAGEFVRVVRDQLEQETLTRGATITLRTTTGIDVLDARDILFAETSGAGPVIHLAQGRDVQLRGTLQGLFEQMSHDTRFAKAGGSFIVNLENVRSAGKSSIVFPDGSVIIVPIRARKPFQEALEAYRAG